MKLEAKNAADLLTAPREYSVLFYLRSVYIAFFSSVFMIHADKSLICFRSISILQTGLPQQVYGQIRAASAYAGPRQVREPGGTVPNG